MKSESWVLCPLCNSKTRLKVFDTTVIKNLPLFCPKCKRQTIINIEKLKITSSDQF